MPAGRTPHPGGGPAPGGLNSVADGGSGAAGAH